MMGSKPPARDHVNELKDRIVMSILVIVGLTTKTLDPETYRINDVKSHLGDDIVELVELIATQPSVRRPR
jgi:hypothetical protein